MNDFESKCYGMSEADIRTGYMESFTAKHVGLEMVVMSILSDCQELMAMDATEQARKELNRAKYILGEMMDQRRSAELLADEISTNE